MPSIVRKARSESFLIAAGTFGSLVASASCTLTSLLSISIDFTNPNETMSRVKPGYFTDFNAFFTCSSEIDMHEDYVCCVRGKPCLEFSSIRSGEHTRLACMFRRPRRNACGSTSTRPNSRRVRDRLHTWRVCSPEGNRYAITGAPNQCCCEFGKSRGIGRCRFLKKIDALMRLAYFNDEPRIIPLPK